MPWAGESVTRTCVEGPHSHLACGISRAGSGSTEHRVCADQRQRMVTARPRSTTRRRVSQVPAPQHTADPTADGRGPVLWGRGPQADALAVRGMRPACRRRKPYVQRRFAIKTDHDP
ncbi:hypothetical protein GCM10010255_40380 [Streptomyces coeruleofuscus]|uniref:Uncharacterized protein n=1 Tax=Streptomyces coeruleofuscus TaxID=66879 RepID=A0ABP5VIL0_9ACTN